MADISCADARMADVYALAASLREGDAKEVLAFCTSIRRMLRTSFRLSYWRKSYFVDGKIAAMVGMSGTLLGDTGLVWMLTTPEVERVPLSYARLCRAGVADMLKLKPRLEGFVAADYPQAIGFLRILGFAIHPAVPCGRRGELFHKITLER